VKGEEKLAFSDKGDDLSRVALRLSNEALDTSDQAINIGV
jgi:hypothetical protein